MQEIKWTGNRINSDCTTCKRSRSMLSAKQVLESDVLVMICPECFKDIMIARIRQFQNEEGNPDCFGKSDGSCDQKACKFRIPCLTIGRSI